MFLLPVLLFLPLPGCHLLSSHLSVAHNLTPSSYDCFLMALPFYFSLSLFPFLLSLSCHSSVSHPAILSRNHFNKTANENSGEQKWRGNNFVPIEWWAKNGLHFFYVYDKDSFSVPGLFPLRPIFREKNTWGLLKMGKNVLLIHASIRKMCQKPPPLLYEIESLNFNLNGNTLKS